MNLDLSKFDGCTPGPWSVQHVCNLSVAGNALLSSSIYIFQASLQIHPDSVETNRQLLEAAPELLAEVKRLRAELAELKKQEVQP